MSFAKISPEDPRLTAYALGELEGEERAAFEAELNQDPSAQAVVAEIRATATQLEQALAAEPMDASPAAPQSPAVRRRGKLLRFPQAYFVVGGLAAACFAVFVAIQPAFQKEGRKHTYQAVELVAPAAEKKAALEPTAAAAADASNGPTRPDPVLAGSTNRVMAEAEAKDESAAAGRADQLARAQERESQAQAAAQETRDGLAKSVTERTYGFAVKGISPQPLGGLQQNRANPSVATDDRGYLSASPAPAPTTASQAVREEVVTLAPFMVETNAPAARRGLHRANTESYAYRAENDFLGAAENPLSTFSIDVDTASYANMRRFILGGSLPPADAVRIEELVNYFPYGYPPPSDTTPFSASMEVANAPWAPTHRLVRIGLKGREVAQADRPAANLVFLVDVSGSMNEPNKLPLVKQAMRRLVSRLRADDRVAIVVYAGNSGLALPSTPVRQASRILAALDELTPGGSTNGAEGIELAYDVAKAHFVTGGLNRVILCTDGDFNVGTTSEGELVRLIKEKAKTGVYLTALGFGMGNYKDNTIQQLADQGNGNYGYIDSPREAEKLLVEQVDGTLMTIAKDVKIQVEFNPALVASYRLIGYEKRLLKKEDFNDDTVDAGEIGAGHTVTALYEVVPFGAAEQPAGTRPAVDDLKYRVAGATQDVRGAAARELLTLKIRFKDPAGDVSRKLEFPLTDAMTTFPKASADFRFAAAVAEFGMILRDSAYKGSGTMADVIAWAQSGIGSDPGGYRNEFLDLARRAQQMVR